MHDRRDNDVRIDRRHDHAGNPWNAGEIGGIAKRHHNVLLLVPRHPVNETLIEPEKPIPESDYWCTAHAASRLCNSAYSPFDSRINPSPAAFTCSQHRKWYISPRFHVVELVKSRLCCSGFAGFTTS